MCTTVQYIKVSSINIYLFIFVTLPLFQIKYLECGVFLIVYAEGDSSLSISRVPTTLFIMNDTTQCG